MFQNFNRPYGNLIIKYTEPSTSCLVDADVDVDGSLRPKLKTLFAEAWVPP